MAKSFHFVAVIAIVAAFFVACDNKGNEKENELAASKGIGAASSTTDPGVVINGVRYATRNVDEPGFFAEKPVDAGKIYQWNRKKAYSATGDISDWDSSSPSGAIYEATNDPCPEGWRMPSKAENENLMSAASVWKTVNGVSGRTFGTEPNTIFLPAAGYRSFDQGVLTGAGTDGYYWSATISDAAAASYPYSFSFNDNRVYFDPHISRQNGGCVRCVHD